MPYKSEAQRKWMHVNKPQMAKRWDKEYGGKIKKKSGKISTNASRKISSSQKSRISKRK